MSDYVISVRGWSPKYAALDEEGHLVGNGPCGAGEGYSI